MNRKALMGIEYTAVIGLILLMLTFSGSSVVPAEGRAGGSGDPGPSGASVDPPDDAPPGPGGSPSGGSPEGGDSGSDTDPSGGGIGSPQDPDDDEPSGSGPSTPPPTITSVGSGKIIPRFTGVGTQPPGQAIPVTTFTSTAIDGSQKTVNLVKEPTLWYDAILTDVNPNEEMQIFFFSDSAHILKLVFTSSETITDALTTVEKLSDQDQALIDQAFEGTDRRVIDATRVTINYHNNVPSPIMTALLPQSITSEAGLEDFTFTKIHPDGTTKTFTTTTVEKIGDTLAVSAHVDFNSLFVIDARDIVKGPSLCNNDGTCSPPTETKATCPADCLDGSSSLVCQPNKHSCIGNVLYDCQPDGQNLRQLENCEFGCADGVCLTVDQASDSGNFIYIMLVTVVVVMGLAVTAMFMRK